MRIFLIILVLFSISLIPENIGFNFEFELRPLVFAVLTCGMILQLSFSVWRKDVELKKTKFKFVSIDLAYTSCVLLTILSFVTKAQSIYAFHYTFVASGMLVVYFFIRIMNLNEISFLRKKNYSPDGNFVPNDFVNKFKVQSTKNQVQILIVGIVFIIAAIGLVQFVMGKPVVSTFGRTSFLGCFLAMNVPIAFGLVLATWKRPHLSIRYSAPACAGRYRVFGIQLLKLLSLVAFVVLLGVTVLTKSRSALIALAVVLPLMIIATKSQRHKEKSNDCQKPKTKLYKKIRRVLFSCLGVLVALFFIFNIGKAVYKIRPMSASGRVLIWKVSAEMFKKNPVSGVGFGNFANTYNFYQANYFASGKGSVINKMTAGQIRHAYNWYLETAAEFGVFGLVFFGIFWWLILMEIYKIFLPRNTRKNTENIQTEYRTPNTEYFLNMGMAGAVLCFMIMSLFQFPRKIIPTYLMFNFALAWIVNANLEENSKAQMINNKQIPKEENL